MTIPAMPNHLDQGTLRLYALGGLPTCQSATVEIHLANCAYCRADLREMEELFVALPTLIKTVSQEHWTA